MATVSASLKMFDMMSRPLQQVTQALNLTISAMDQMNNAANKDIKLSNTLNTAKESIRRANAEMQQLITTQDKLNNSLNKGNFAFDSLSNKISKLIKGYLGLKVAEHTLGATIGGAMSLQQQLFTLQGIMGNKDVATAYFNNLQKKANESVFGFEDFASNARKFMQFTKNTDSLDKLANLSERLTLMDPSQGLQGAGFALKEMMSGDGVSLKERFGFGKADIEILKASKDMNTFISKFDTLLNKKGFTEKMIEQYNKSAAAQFGNLQSNIKTAMAQAGEGALEILNPLITKMNQGFKDGNFQTFFNNIGAGLSILTNSIVGVIDIVQYVSDVFQNNWSVIGPIVYGIASALGVYYLALLAVNGAIAFSNIVEGISNGIKSISAARSMMQAGATFSATIAQHGLNAALLACPLTWIIGLTVGFIVALATATAFSDKFRNGFANAFQGVANACATAFGFVVQTVQNTLNWIIDKINSLLSAVNTVTNATASLWGGSGTNFKLGKVDFGGFKSAGQNAIKSFGASGAQKIRNFSSDNIKNSIKNAMGLGGLKDIKQPKMPDMNAWNKKQGPGTLAMAPDKHAKGAHKHLKNIDDKIDVSNQHLEMLRDLAQQESVQNFTTLSPTVQITTGDIREEADVDKIISKIENYMENQLVNSAEGVYS